MVLLLLELILVSFPVEEIESQHFCLMQFDVLTIQKKKTFVVIAVIQVKLLFVCLSLGSSYPGLFALWLSLPRCRSAA